MLFTNKKKTPKLGINYFNFGPQHPSADNVLRLVLELGGERVVRADPHVGLLHRGTEKLIEHKTSLQAPPYFDRLDYVSMMTQEHGHSLPVENLLNNNINLKARSLKALYSELIIKLKNILSLTSRALDVGNRTVRRAVKDNEKCLDSYVSSRVHKSSVSAIRFSTKPVLSATRGVIAFNPRSVPTYFPTNKNRWGLRYMNTNSSKLKKGILAGTGVATVVAGTGLTGKHITDSLVKVNKTNLDHIKAKGHFIEKEIDFRQKRLLVLEDREDRAFTRLRQIKKEPQSLVEYFCASATRQARLREATEAHVRAQEEYRREFTQYSEAVSRYKGLGEAIPTSLDLKSLWSYSHRDAKNISYGLNLTEAKQETPELKKQPSSEEPNEF